MALIKRQKKKHKTHWGNGCMILTSRLLCSQLDSCKRQLSPRSQMFIITIIIFIPTTQQLEQERLAENQPLAGLSSQNEYENGMRISETVLWDTDHKTDFPVCKKQDGLRTLWCQEKEQFLYLVCCKHSFYFFVG